MFITIGWQITTELLSTGVDLISPIIELIF